MTITYRPAHILDHPELAKLYGQFVNQPERYLAGNEDSFQAVLSSQSVKLIVAESANKIVGFVCFSIRSVFRYPRPIVEVEEIYVTEEHRRKGVATGLIKVVDDFAKETDAYYVFLASDETRKNAHQFYKSLGYDQYAFHFRRKC